jgi:hypothetical protein
VAKRREAARLALRTLARQVDPPFGPPPRTAVLSCARSEQVIEVAVAAAAGDGNLAL